MGGGGGGDSGPWPSQPLGPGGGYLGPGTGPVAFGGGSLSPNPGSYQNQQIQFPYDGLPNNFPQDALTQGFQNIGSLYGGVGQQAPGYYSQAQGQAGIAGNQGLQQLGDIYGLGAMKEGGIGGQAQGQIAGLENQNMGQVQGLLDNYNKQFMTDLGPQGKLGSQMMGEFNNYGLTPDSGAFQAALGNQLGSLGAQNALTLGQQALQPGINAQYGALGQTLGSQLGTTQQGAQQAGALSNLNTQNQQQLAQQGALSPLNYMNQALGQQAGIVNQATQMPIDYWGSEQNANLAQMLQGQNQSAQNSAAQMGMYGNLGGAGIGALGSYMQGAGAFK